MDYEFTRNRLRAVFDQAGLSQKDFAIKCDLTQSTVTRLLSGKRSPQLVTLIKICKAFEVKPSYFVRELQDEALQPTPVIEDPLAPFGSVARGIINELYAMSDLDMVDVLDYIRFRKRQGKRKKA